MKNFNIFGVHGKIRVLEGGFTKNQYIGGDCLKKGELGQFADLRRGLARERVWCFWGKECWYSSAHYEDMGPVNKYVTRIIAFFASFNFVTKFYSITSLVLFPKLY